MCNNRLVIKENEREHKIWYLKVFTVALTSKCTAFSVFTIKEKQRRLSKI